MKNLKHLSCAFILIAGILLVPQAIMGKSPVLPKTLGTYEAKMMQIFRLHYSGVVTDGELAIFEDIFANKVLPFMVGSSILAANPGSKFVTVKQINTFSTNLGITSRMTSLPADHSFSSADIIGELRVWIPRLFSTLIAGSSPQEKLATVQIMVNRVLFNYMDYLIRKGLLWLPETSQFPVKVKKSVVREEPLLPSFWSPRYNELPWEITNYGTVTVSDEQTVEQIVDSQPVQYFTAAAAMLSTLVDITVIDPDATYEELLGRQELVLSPADLAQFKIQQAKMKQIFGALQRIDGMELNTEERTKMLRSIEADNPAFHVYVPYWQHVRDLCARAEKVFAVIYQRVPAEELPLIRPQISIARSAVRSFVGSYGLETLVPGVPDDSWLEILANIIPAPVRIFPEPKLVPVIDNSAF